MLAVLIGVLVVSAHTAVAAPLSAKRGFADTGGNYAWLQATNAGWYHTWGGGLGYPGDFDALHVPMFRWWTNIDNQIDLAINRPEPTEWVMCFNEPERSDQDNLSVSEAISRCWTIANGLSGTGIKIASPAVSDDGTGQAWLASFMSQANAQGLPIDAVCFHWYGVSNPNDPIGAANTFISRVDSYHSSYGKPVWIPEFAIHDWGGNYSDGQIRAANAIFLDNVVPRLESRSYVAGYAFYNWFGDSHLVEGSPLKPTNVGIPYVGTLESGETYDFAGVDFGEHVAYLYGGDLTLNAAPGALNYINALGKTSVISGSVDWTLADGWIRIQAGAVLRKKGANQITWDGASINNQGVLEVVDGTLRLDSSTTYSGAGDVLIRPNGELAYTGRGSRITLDYDAELAGGILSTTLSGGFEAPSGITLFGAGDIVGNLHLLAGAWLQVGDAGLPAVPSQFVIDDLESYATGLVRDVADPPWTAHGGTSFAAIEDTGGGNQALSFGWSSSFRGVSRALPEEAQIANDAVATIFFRINSKTDDPDHNIGLSDVLNTDDVFFDDFEVQVRCASDSVGGSNTFGLDARSGGSFVDLADGLITNTWYNVWLVIDQTNDTFDVYLNTGTGDATSGNKLNAAPLAFRNGTTDVLNAFVALAGSSPVDLAVQVDDIAYLDGVDLTNPLGGLNPVDQYHPATLALADDLTVDSGATLEVGIVSPTNHDVLAVGGLLSAGGMLDVPLTAGATLPQSGDAFNILDADSFSGTFDQIDLAVLPIGTLWDLRELYTTGTIAVLSAADALENSAGCFTGPDNVLPGYCSGEDQDSDNDNDLHDFAQLQDCVLDPSGVIPADCW